jgi:hypothetical protein
MDRIFLLYGGMFLFWGGVPAVFWFFDTSIPTLIGLAILPAPVIITVIIANIFDI